MCGFAGYVGKTECGEEVLERMMDRIVHRGPDSGGKFMDAHAGLGFRRLSIIDLSESGDQPFYNEDRSKVLVFNGEIYNFQSLRRELIEAGHVFVSGTDSETLVHGYEQWGEKLVDRLRGMYAFVIWDREKQELFGARDHFGIKPFYYACMNHVFMFGSEIKSLLEHPAFEKKFNEEALEQYLSFQFVPTAETFFKGVYCLEPGHYFRYRHGRFETARYFDPMAGAETKASFEDVVDQVESVMKESVEAHKISDVEVASYLSSGVDSSYLTYLGGVDHTFTVGFDEGKYSEIADAKQFAASIGMENDAKVISPAEYWEKLSDIMYYMDEPVADPAAVALYFLSREASKKVKVVLSGEGSDELFGGYNIYTEPLMHTAYERLPLSLRRAVAYVAERALPVGAKGRGFLMRRGKTLEQRYFSNATNVFTSLEKARILKRKCRTSVTDVTAPLYEKVRGKDPVSKMQYIDMHIWLVHDILMKGDKMGMANSLEVRVPFLDREVFSLTRTLPLAYKVRAPKTKVALRAAAGRVIRKKTSQKKKLGFPIPIRVWLRQEQYYRRVLDMFRSEYAQRFFKTDELVRMLDEHRAGTSKNEKTDASRKIWAVYVFLVWYDRYFGSDYVAKPSQ